MVWNVRQNDLGRKRYIFREALIMMRLSGSGRRWSRRLEKNVEEVEGIEDTDMHMEKSLERITKKRDCTV